MKDLLRMCFSMLVIVLMLVGSGAVADPNPHTKTPFRIKSADWSEQIEVLRVQGKGQYLCIIEIFNEGNNELLGATQVPPGKNWFLDIPETAHEPSLDTVPCKVGAHQIGTSYCEDDYDTMDVQNAPDDCGPIVE